MRPRHTTCILSDGREKFKTMAAPNGSEGVRAAQFLDYDNDGLLDCVALTDKGLRVWRNIGNDYNTSGASLTGIPVWTDVSERARSNERGGGPLPVGASRVLAADDIDQDGDEDLIFLSSSGELRIARNDGGTNKSLRVNLAGKVSNRSGVGAKIEARAGNTEVGAAPCMVRIRKNANNLKPPEKVRFVAAFAQLNNQGLGRFADFRNMHRTQVELNQAHGAPGFLPWHRAYLLDLERELQAIDPSVALPYWRFDLAAPNIFKPDFMGVSDPIGTVSFANNNPLQFWKTDGQTGVNRRPLFNINVAPPGLRTEAQTLALGTNFSAFRIMEGNPHGSAHTSFGGMIQSPGTAPRDPLFFLLHCNVDRLWAKWQKQNSRFDPATVASFNNNNANPRGHRLQDTMWPWNGVINPPDTTRPPNAPGGTLAPSPIVPAPGLSPRVQDMLDFHGVISAASNEGFDYDDVPL